MQILLLGCQAQAEGSPQSQGEGAKEVEASLPQSTQKGDEKNTFQALVVVLTRLVLQNSQELRTIIGCIFATWLRKADSSENIVEKVGLKAGAQYDKAAKDMKAKKEQAEKEGAEEVDLGDLGPPYLHLWWRRWLRRQRTRMASQRTFAHHSSGTS